MPIKNKSEVTTPPAAVDKTAKPAVKKPVAAGAKAASTKTAANPANSAATHKAPARHAAAKKLASPIFDIELHRAEIEREAYLMWAARGHEHGQSQHDWLAAIELVKARQQG
jgi:transketolase